MEPYEVPYEHFSIHIRETLQEIFLHLGKKKKALLFIQANHSFILLISTKFIEKA